MPEETDLNLVKRARNGEQEAFRALVERYQRKVYSIAFNVVHDSEDAMDLSQDAFVKVFRNLHGFQGQSSFYTWLYRIVVNLGIDHLRKKGRVQTVDYDDKFQRNDASAQGGSSILPSQLGTDPRKALARRELIDQIQRALESLSENHRLAIVLSLDSLLAQVPERRRVARPAALSSKNIYSELRGMNCLISFHTTAATLCPRTMIAPWWSPR